MTPERAAYHRLMLILGIREDYDREMDMALENQDPITAPVLDLAFCLSDTDRTISVLNEYILDYTIDQEQVYDMMLAKLRQLYANGTLSTVRVCQMLNDLPRLCDLEEPWIKLYTYLDLYDMWDACQIPLEVLEYGFEAIFLRGEQINVWELLKFPDKIQKESLFDFFRKTK